MSNQPDEGTPPTAGNPGDDSGPPATPTDPPAGPAEPESPVSQEVPAPEPLAAHPPTGEPVQPPAADATLPTTDGPTPDAAHGVADPTPVPDTALPVTDGASPEPATSPWAGPAPAGEAPASGAPAGVGTTGVPDGVAVPSAWAAPVPGSGADGMPPPGADQAGPIPVAVIPAGPPPPGHLYPPAWDAGAPEPRPRKSRRKMWLSLLAAGIVAVLLVVGYTAVRFLVDLGSYNDGHEAYERADCAAAVSEFDSVINGWRLVTLGGTVRRAESEKAECLVFREAADRQQAGDKPAALTAYTRFVPGRPASPLTDAARKRVGELFGGPDLAALATVESCGALDVMRTEKLLVADSAPGFHAACGATLAKAHEMDKALAAYGRLFTDYGDHKVAAETEAKISSDPGWCLELGRVRADPVLSVRGGLLGNLLATCATASVVPDGAAKQNAEEFLQKYPGHPRTGEVLGALARLINKAAREVSGANDIGQAELTRTVGGNEAVIMVYNDSDDPLQVAFSGPQPRVETLDPCSTCTSRAPGDNICRDAATLKRIVVAAGEYDVAFTTPKDNLATRDAFAHWSLQPGKEYYACLITQQRT